MGVIPLNVRFDGHMVTMGGVGGVATLPEHRRKGAIRVCMDAALKKMYADGDVFSVLYPFSRAYYRQFGYEDGASMVRWTMPFASMKLPEVGGTMQLILPGDDLSPFRALILPDSVQLAQEEAARIQAFIARGGHIPAPLQSLKN